MTLVELLTTLAISGVIMVGITSAFLAQTRQYQIHASRQGLQSNVRRGMMFMEDRLRAAGYGVDPRFTFTAYDGFDVQNTNAPNLNFPDAITILTRDPRFQRTTNSALTTSSTQMTLNAAASLSRGQILLILCPGAEDYAYVTVQSATNTNVVTFNPVASAANPETPISLPGARFHQQANFGPGCFGNTGQMKTVVKIDRYSFYVAAFDDDGNPSSPPTPYLMLHQGLDVAGTGTIGTASSPVNAEDGIPLAHGIEQLQIAYILNPAPNAVPTILGVDASPGWGPAWAGSSLIPAMSDSYDSPNRTISHPANIRQVRVTMVARSPVRIDAFEGDDMFESGASWATETLSTSGVVAWRQLENLDPNANNVFRPDDQFRPPGTRYARTTLRLSVSPKNLLLRSQFLPPNDLGG